MKRFHVLALMILSLLLIITGVGGAGHTALAAGEEFIITADGVLEEYTGSSKNVTIPDGVTVIGAYAFAENDSITQVVIPATVKRIEDYAFLNCDSLKKIIIPDSVTEIGDGAFMWCADLEEIVLPKGLTRIGREAFRQCSSLESIIIPDGVTKLEDQVLMFCFNLKSVIIPDTVTEIGQEAFWLCQSLEKIVIPNSVVRIGNRAFVSSGLKAIELPGSVTELGDSVFVGCKQLEKAVLPASLKTYGSYLFKNCRSLSSVVLPEKISYITDGMFYGCEKLKKINNKKISKIGKESFLGCKALTGINLQYTSEIGDMAFAGCTSLKSVELSSSLTRIPERLFYGCSNLAEIKNIGSIKEVGKDAFTGTKWVLNQREKGSFLIISDILIDAGKVSGQVEIPKNIKTIYPYAFYENSLVSSITVSDATTSVGALAFAYCSNLKAVYIPEQVKEIKDSAFYGCNKLTAIYGKAGSYAEEYAKKHGIRFVASSAASMRKDVEKAEKAKEEKAMLYENMVIEVGCTGMFKIDDDLMASYQDISFKSLNSSIIKVNSYGDYEQKDTGTALVIMEGTKNKKSTILKVFRITGIKANAKPISITHDAFNEPMMLGLADGTVIVAETSSNKDYDQAKIICYDSNGKVKWQHTLKASAEDKNSSDLFKTYFLMEAKKLLLLSDGNVLAIGHARGRVNGITKSQYNSVTSTWAVKIEAKTGKILWEQLVPSRSTCRFFYDAIEKEDGSIIICTDGEDGNYIIHLAKDGAVLSETLYSIIVDTTGFSSVRTPVPLEDGSILLTYNRDNYLYIFSLKYGNQEVAAKIPVELNAEHSYMIKGNHNDYYAVLDDVLIHLDSEFNIIKKHTLNMSNLSKVYKMENDKIVLVGGSYFKSKKLVIFDCVTETSSTIHIDSARLYSALYDDQSLVLTGYENNKIYLYKFKADDLLNSTKDIQNVKIGSIKAQKYTGSTIKPELTVYDGDKKLVKGKDYSVTYYNNKKKGTAAAIVFGKNKYYGVRIIYFDIK
ncbi:MAG: leucine-rich repeat domain-containing protein [Clostridiales bacterium]|nr:leucine-rich repeat domain-containing protein [Clostridiales bacterium]